MLTTVCEHKSVTGSTIAVDGRGVYAALGGPKGLVLIDLEWPWEPCNSIRLTPTPEAVIALAWHPMPSREGVIACAGEHGALVVCDLSHETSARAQLTTLRRSGGAGQPQAAASKLAWHPEDAHALATRSSEGALVLWDVRVAGQRHAQTFSGPGAASSAEQRLGGKITYRDGDSGLGSAARQQGGSHEGALCWDPHDSHRLACTQVRPPHSFLLLLTPPRFSYCPSMRTTCHACLRVAYVTCVTCATCVTGRYR